MSRFLNPQPVATTTTPNTPKITFLLPIGTLPLFPSLPSPPSFSSFPAALKNTGNTPYAITSAVNAPTAPAIPNSRNGLAVARSNDMKPRRVVSMAQKDGPTVSRRAYAAGSVSPVATPRRQFAAKNTVCDRVRTNTITAIFAVRSPMPIDRICASTSVNEIANRQVASVPTTSHMRRYTAPMIRPNSRSAADEKTTRSRNRFRLMSSMMYGTPET